jgi:PilZ domain
MPDLRWSKRAKTLWGAKIIFNNRMSTMDCIVKNISSSGAKLALSGSLPVPNEFELHIPRKGRSYRARLVRRDSEGIGVALPSADAKRPASASACVRIGECATKSAHPRLEQKALGSWAGSGNRQYIEC